ncbi:MAG: heparin lyase I family protein [Flavobacteriaceae bacterium]
MRHLEAIIILFIVLVGCKEDTALVQTFNDNFDYHNSIWETYQVTDSSRFILTPEPTNFNNNCLKFSLFPNDFHAGNKRNEFVLLTNDSIGRVVEYSFKFMFPRSFFEKEKKVDWIMIHQWHDEPPKGISWKNYQENTKPPIALYVSTSPDGRHKIVYNYGLESNNFQEKKHFIYKRYIRPNVWYTFSNTIKWSFNKNDGYSIPRINEEYLTSKGPYKASLIEGNNMYNEVSNYFKIGLYGYKKHQDTLFIYIDDFKYTLKESNP